MNKMYEGKFFYKVNKAEDGTITLLGPLETIFYLNQVVVSRDPVRYLYAEVIDGRMERALTAKEVIVTEVEL